ncbi:MAG TPA: nitrogenase component 1 [Methanobacterium sp.]|nr:nitrogenase component 1 [Methanobacterium sp.]
MESLRTCKLFGVIRAVLGIKGALPLIHGPVGCFYHIKYLISIRSGRQVTILSTEMDQDDVVFGGEEKLLQKILEADQKYQPKIITVLSSCASSIIGENIDLVLDKARNQVQCELFSINSGGFEGTQIEGYQECLNVLSKFMKTAPREDSVNLIGQYRGGPDLKVLKDYFKKLGLELNCILTSGCSLQDIKQVPKASLNISMCEASGVEFCQWMQREFKIPFLSETIPLGVTATSHYFKEICREMNREYIFEEQEEQARNEVRQFKDQLKDKKAVIVAGATRALALTEFIYELGMEPVLICLDFPGEYTDEKLDELIRRCNRKPVILKQPDYFEILDNAKKLNPDIILGGMGEIGLSSELRIPLIDVMHAQKTTFCFEGAVLMAGKIVDNLNG